MTAVPAEPEPLADIIRPALRLVAPRSDDDPVSDYIAALVAAAPPFSAEIREQLIRVIG